MRFCSSNQLLDALAVADVADHGEHAGLAVQLDHVGREQAVEQPPGFVAEAHLLIHQLALPEQQGDGALALSRLGPDAEVGGLLADGLLGPVAEDLLEGRVDVDVAPGGERAEDDGVGAGVEYPRQFLLGDAQRRFGLPMLAIDLFKQGVVRPLELGLVGLELGHAFSQRLELRQGVRRQLGGFFHGEINGDSPPIYGPPQEKLKSGLGQSYKKRRPPAAFSSQALTSVVCL
jgi:hypothetical protein